MMWMCGIETGFRCHCCCCRYSSSSSEGPDVGGAQGQAVDIEIQAKEILFLKETLNGLMAEHTGQPLDKISEDTDRDYFLSPAEAVQYGLIDRVVDSSEGEGIITES